MIIKIEDKETKENICMEILEALPEWIGKKLFDVFYLYAKEKNYEFIQVKTVCEGIYADYNLTNAFYQKMGFKELECMEELWDKANLCQVYVMAVK